MSMHLRQATRIQQTTLLCLLLAPLVALWMDPYSHGFVGGDWTYLFDEQLLPVPNHPWQQWTALISACLLGLGAGALFLQKGRVGVGLLIAELILFLGSNAVYLHRDGMLRFLSKGYDHSLSTLWIVCAGLLLRLSVVLIVARVLPAAGPRWQVAAPAAAEQGAAGDVRPGIVPE